MTPENVRPEAGPVRRALITAAGTDSRKLPLQHLFDARGAWKSAVQIQLDELMESGIERVGLIVRPGDRDAFAREVRGYGQSVELIVQEEPRGYGHAVLCGREFIGGEPFLLQVSDHLYVSRSQKSCTAQLLAIAAQEACPVFAVQATPEQALPYFGTVAGTLMPGKPGYYQVEQVLEKPTPTLAEQVCSVPGLRRGYYLCFFGMHILGPRVFALLERNAESPEMLGLSGALSELASGEQCLAVELDGRRVDLEARFGILRAQLALGLAGPAREELLTALTEEMAADAAGR